MNDVPRRPGTPSCRAIGRHVALPAGIAHTLACPAVGSRRDISAPSEHPGSLNYCTRCYSKVSLNYLAPNKTRPPDPQGPFPSGLGNAGRSPFPRGSGSVTALNLRIITRSGCVAPPLSPTPGELKTGRIPSPPRSGMLSTPGIAGCSHQGRRRVAHPCRAR